MKILMVDDDLELLSLIGFALTFVFDLLTTLSEIIVLDLGVYGLLARITSGFSFYLLHQISNALVFAFFLPILLRQLRQLPVFHASLATAKALQRPELQPSLSLPAEKKS